MAVIYLDPGTVLSAEITTKICELVCEVKARTKAEHGGIYPNRKMSSSDGDIDLEITLFKDGRIEVGYDLCLS